MIGEQILNYRIEELIGEGGMGNVYLATHRQINRKVAIKVLNPSLARNPEIRERFRNEAATLSQLQHPNIVTLYDYVDQENASCLIMEYVLGYPLDAYIHSVSGPIPAGTAIPLFIQLLDGFAYAHARGVVHRDAKPANFIRMDTGRMKILDFGIAKILHQQDYQLTRAGTRIGSVLYMSPEQVKGEAVDIRTDVYALGITLFEMLTGTYVYDQHQITEFDIYQRILYEPLPRLREVYPAIPESLQAVVDKATAKDPQERYPDAIAFREVLNHLLHTGFQIPSAPEPTQAIPQPVPPSKAEKIRRLREQWQAIPLKWKRNAAGGLGILLILMLILWNTRHSRYGEEDLQRRVIHFYQAIETHTFSSIRPFYRPDSIRYYRYKNVSRGELAEIYQNYWRFTPEERHKIDWSSFTFEVDDTGNYVIYFPLTYYYKRANSDTWQQTQSGTVIKMDKDLQIFYLGGR